MSTDEAAAGRAALVLRCSVDSGDLPGAVLLVGHGADHAVPVALGAAQLAPPEEAREMRPETLFDLASLTKVVSTLPCVLLLADRGEVDLDAPVRRYLPELSGGRRDEVTVRHLLTHTSGLPAQCRYHDEPDPSRIRAGLLATPLETAPGAAVRYSDVGFLLLGFVVEAVGSTGLDATAHDLVFGPVGMRRTTFRPQGADAAACAATEEGPDGRPIVGRVHDENAAAMGGVAGHAGLFSDAADLGRYAAAWVDQDGPLGLSPGCRADALRCQTAAADGHRGLGWVCRGDGFDHMGRYWSAHAVGHTGFTGTSIALDPVGGRWAVLLTNAVHLGRGRSPIVALRRQVHDALMR